MARRPSSAARPQTNSSHVNGVRPHTNGELPPPSTLAAQIVQNQARNEASQHNGEKTTFAGLLQEILHSGATPETDIQVNVQLITVVVEAGLTVLTRDDPFAQWDVLLPQALDSIAVVQATILRQPGVLLTPISSEGPQLLLWLLARLLAVCGKRKCQDLPIAALMNAAISSFDRSTKLWKFASLLRELVRDCVDGRYSYSYGKCTSRLFSSQRLLRGFHPMCTLLRRSACLRQDGSPGFGQSQRTPSRFLTTARPEYQTRILSFW